MHLPDAPDTVANKHVLGPPKSIIGRHLLNALAYEIANLIINAGLTLNPDGASDEANTGWEQLWRAVNKLAGHDEDYTGFANIGQNGFGVGTEIIRTVTSDPFTVTSLYHVTMIIESGSPFPNGIVRLEENANYANRMLILHNGTPSTKQIQTQSGGALYNLSSGFSGIFHTIGGLWKPVKLA